MPIKIDPALLAIFANQQPLLSNLFTPIWADIEIGKIKTNYQLTLALDLVATELNISTLKTLILFRAWLHEKQINLHTDHGIVLYEKYRLD